MASEDPKRLDGKKISEEIHEELAKRVATLKEKHNIVPGLAVILVGERKDSATYVRMKEKSAKKDGLNFVLKNFPDTISEADLLKEVEALNKSAEVHGLIVQLPLPAHINEKTILDAVGIDKDIDGFHPLNIGRLAMKGREPSFVSCTPQGCIELLERTNVKLEGKHVVVIGRSNIVGIPVAHLCLNRNATITICHSRTANIDQVVKQADIVIAAVGRAEMVKKDWVKPGAVVIDVGINAVDDSTRKAGYRLVGDVDYKGVKEVASSITPVPGGVGPMTVAMLIKNTVIAAERLVQKQ